MNEPTVKLPISIRLLVITPEQVAAVLQEWEWYHGGLSQPYPQQVYEALAARVNARFEGL